MCNALVRQTAVVTGGANGIGRSIALVLSKQGASVAIVDMDQDAGIKTAAAVRSQGTKAVYVRTDVSNPRSVARMAERVMEDFGRVDILVNNAAIFPRASFADITWKDWSRVVSINLSGPFLCTKALVPGMIAMGFGRIINVSSNLGVTGGVKAAHYSTTKGGLITFTKCLARELARSGITANAIVPGLTDTNMLRRGQSEEEVRALVEQIPMRRLARPAEIAEFVAFIAGPGCSYVTGQTFYVNGGWIMP